MAIRILGSKEPRDSKAFLNLLRDFASRYGCRLLALRGQKVSRGYELLLELSGENVMVFTLDLARAMKPSRIDFTREVITGWNF